MVSKIGNLQAHMIITNFGLLVKPSVAWKQIIFILFQIELKSVVNFKTVNNNPPRTFSKKGAKTRKILESGGTPFLYAVFYLASTGSYDFDYKIFRLVSFVFYI